MSTTRGGSQWASPSPTFKVRPPPTKGAVAGRLKKAIAASAIGNATEWFDYGIYAYGVTYISTAIFPGNTESATLLALMTSRCRSWSDLSAVWYGVRSATGSAASSVLAITILMMSGATLCVGLVPSYAHDRLSGRRCCWYCCG